jgi:ubiquinone/menaquinone biosynthesis C-methylase UbiE
LKAHLLNPSPGHSGDPLPEGEETRTGFDALAAKYDDVFSNSAIGRAQRDSVWAVMDGAFRPGQRILEINCGTGIDALHLAERGITVVACDSSAGMISEARRRLAGSERRVTVELRCLPTQQVAELEAEGTFDGALSNFAGLNCVSDLSQVARNLARLINPGGKVVLCLFGRTCLWEILWYSAHGNLRKAFRRWDRTGTTANLSPGSTITVHYPSVRQLRRIFSPAFRLESRIGVGVTTPPSYALPLAVRFRRLFSLAVRIDPWLGGCPGARGLADHVVLTFTRSD